MSVNHRKIYKWVETFRRGRTGIDEARSGRPSSVTYVKEHDDKNIRDNRIISIDEISSVMRIYHRHNLCKNDFSSNRKIVF